MNQSKLDVVKQEMARVRNQWTIKCTGMLVAQLCLTMGMGEFNSDDHYIYYRGQESLRRNGVALIVNKRIQKAVLTFQKWQSDLGSFPKKTIQYQSNSSLCPNHWCWRSWSWTVLRRPTRPSSWANWELIWWPLNCCYPLNRKTLPEIYPMDASTMMRSPV